MAYQGESRRSPRQQGYSNASPIRMGFRMARQGQRLHYHAESNDYPMTVWLFLSLIRTRSLISSVATSQKLARLAQLQRNEQPANASDKDLHFLIGPEYESRDGAHSLECLLQGSSSRAALVS